MADLLAIPAGQFLPEENFGWFVNLEDVFVVLPPQEAPSCAPLGVPAGISEHLQFLGSRST